MAHQPVIAQASLAEYFASQLQTCTQDLTHPVAEDTLWYIGNILVTFSDSNALFVDQFERRTLPALALLYRDALAADSSAERLKLLQKLGDSALFIGALFADNYRRRGIHKDYFVGMGGSAYSYLADNARHQRPVYRELARRFPGVLQLIARVCRRELAFNVHEVFEIYQRWQQRQDDESRLQLASLGITPVPIQTH